MELSPNCKTPDGIEAGRLLDLLSGQIFRFPAESAYFMKVHPRGGTPGVVVRAICISGDGFREAGEEYDFDGYARAIAREEPGLPAKAAALALGF